MSPDSGNDIITDFEALVGKNGGNAQGAFDHLALQEIRPEQVRVSDQQVSRSLDGQVYTGVLVSWNTDDGPDGEGSVLLAGLTKEELRQSDFMFVDTPGFVEGINDFGSWYIFSRADCLRSVFRVAASRHPRPNASVPPQGQAMNADRCTARHRGS